MTDVCLKRKIRNYVVTVKDPDYSQDITEGEQGYKIYIKEDVPLNRSDAMAYKYLGLMTNL